MRAARSAVLPALLVLSLGRALAEDVVPADDPALIAKADGVCLQAALVSGGIDKQARAYCTCMAPVLARHMTPESRRLMLSETHDYVRPAYDDPDALYKDAMKSCPVAKP
jgi:hypothetical protein